MLTFGEKLPEMETSQGTSIYHLPDRRPASSSSCGPLDITGQQLNLAGKFAPGIQVPCQTCLGRPAYMPAPWQDTVRASWLFPSQYHLAIASHGLYSERQVH